MASLTQARNTSGLTAALTRSLRLDHSPARDPALSIRLSRHRPDAQIPAPIQGTIRAHDPDYTPSAGFGASLPPLTAGGDYNAHSDGAFDFLASSAAKWWAECGEKAHTGIEGVEIVQLWRKLVYDKNTYLPQQWGYLGQDHPRAYQAFLNDYRARTFMQRQAQTGAAGKRATSKFMCGGAATTAAA